MAVPHYDSKFLSSNKMSNQWQRFANKYDPLAVGSIDGTDTEPHDMGIVRAMNSDYTPDSSLSGDPACTIFVGRLHPKVNEEELEKLFSEYGKVKECIVVRDIVTGNSKQYGFVEFEKEHHADRAYRNCFKTILHGAEILIDREFGRVMEGWKPRRLGGGFGGRKESGQLRFGCRYRQWRPPIIPKKDFSKKNSADKNMRDSVTPSKPRSKFQSAPDNGVGANFKRNIHIFRREIQMFGEPNFESGGYVN